MQAISRPATATHDKKRAFLISYLDIFRPLKKALSLYAAPRTSKEGIFALYGKNVLINELKIKIHELNKELKSYSIDYEKLINSKGANKLKLLRELEEKGEGCGKCQQPNNNKRYTDGFDHNGFPKRSGF